MSRVEFESYCMFTEKKYDQDWFEWCVFVKNDAEELRRIKSVEYRLHPTFPDPIRKVTDRATRFALFSSGWGGFKIGITVTFEDETEERTDYYLPLDKDNWPRKPAPQKLDDRDEEQVLRVLVEGKYRWRKLGTLAKKTAFSEAEVLETLDRLASKELVRKLPYRSIDGQELWAATSIVGISPRI